MNETAKYSPTLRSEIPSRRETGSGNQPDQYVPITPDPRSDDAGQITEVRKDHIGLRRFEAKLDLSGH
jgi:hypothetical protein